MRKLAYLQKASHVAMRETLKDSMENTEKFRCSESSLARNISRYGAFEGYLKVFHLANILDWNVRGVDRFFQMGVCVRHA